jgi:Uma2 family endonuclease
MSIDTFNSWSPEGLVLSGDSYFADMTRDEFFDFCQCNPNVPMERTAEGDLLIMTPAGFESSRRNGELMGQLSAWSKRDDTGEAADSSGGFWLPNGAMRSPDAAWIRRDRLKTVGAAEREKFLPLAPDFVAELRSPTDRLTVLRKKLQEYVDNGVRLAWLIDPIERRVEVYRPGVAPEILDRPTQVSGDPELPGFTLELTPIW